MHVTISTQGKTFFFLMIIFYIVLFVYRFYCLFNEMFLEYYIYLRYLLQGEQQDWRVMR